MKQINVRIIGIIACIIETINAIFFFATGIVIPAVLPFSLLIIILCIMLITKKQFDEGKKSRNRWKFVLYFGTLTCLLCLIVGTLQIYHIFIR